MSPAPRSSSDPRPARTRAAILAAAAEVVAADGLEGARMAVIAKRAGVGVSSLYVHYESKAELVEALIADALERGKDAGGRPVLGRSEDGKAAGLAAGVLDLAFAEPVAMRAMAAVALDSSGASGVGTAFLRERQEAIRSAIAGADASEREGIEPEVASTLLVGLAIGLSSWALRTDDFAIAEPEAREAFALGASLLLRALGDA